jgi:2-C-methyl-D-erythritol 4-phosphate cytidylyltransferase
MQLSVLIVAGGKGERMNTAVPKQFIELLGKPILMRSIENFYQFDNDIDIVVVLPENQIDMWKTLCYRFSFDIHHKITSGGEYRFHSVKNGLALIKDEGLVGIHDGVRPLVNHKTIKQCIKKSTETGAAIPVRDIVESIRKVDKEKSSPLNRDHYKVVQTPQFFRAKLIKEAYKITYREEFTDDATVFENAGHTISVVEGNIENIKITSSADLYLAEYYLHQNRKISSKENIIDH